jgi:hypothetical protein
VKRNSGSRSQWLLDGGTHFQLCLFEISLRVGIFPTDVIKDDNSSKNSQFET